MRMYTFVYIYICYIDNIYIYIIYLDAFFFGTGPKSKSCQQNRPNRRFSCESSALIARGALQQLEDTMNVTLKSWRAPNNFSETVEVGQF